MPTTASAPYSSLWIEHNTSPAWLNDHSNRHLLSAASAQTIRDVASSCMPVQHSVAALPLHCAGMEEFITCFRVSSLNSYRPLTTARSYRTYRSVRVCWLSAWGGTIPRYLARLESMVVATSAQCDLAGVAFRRSAARLASVYPHDL